MKKLFLMACLATQIVSCDQFTETETKTKTKTVVKEKHIVHIVTEQEALELRTESELLAMQIENIESNPDKFLKTIGDVKDYNLTLTRLYENVSKLEKYVDGLTAEDKSFTNREELSISSFESSVVLRERMLSAPVIVSEDHVSQLRDRESEALGHSSYSSSKLEQLYNSLNDQYLVTEEELANYKQDFAELLEKQNSWFKFCEDSFDKVLKTKSFYFYETVKDPYGNPLSDVLDQDKVYKLSDDRVEEFRTDVLSMYKACISEERFPKGVFDQYEISHYNELMDNIPKQEEKIRQKISDLESRL